MYLKNSRKAMSQAIWILIVVVVAIIIGVLVVSVFSKATNNTGNTAAGQIEDSGEGMTTQSCEALCASCKAANGDTSCGAGSPAWTRLNHDGNCANNYCS